MKMNYTIPILFSIILLILPVLFVDFVDSLGYGYFTLLRIFVCVVSIYLAVVSRSKKREGWFWTLVFIAVIFNPIILIHFEKYVWKWIDCLTAGILGWLCLSVSTSYRRVSAKLKDKDFIKREILFLSSKEIFRIILTFSILSLGIYLLINMM